MAKKTYQIKPSIRYSQAFKMEVVRELESSGAPFEHIRRKYGLGVSTVQCWVRKYGNGTRGKVVRVEKPEEIDEKKRMKEKSILSQWWPMFLPGIPGLGFHRYESGL